MRCSLIKPERLQCGLQTQHSSFALNVRQGAVPYQAFANGLRNALLELTYYVTVLSKSETHVCARFVQWLSKEHPELAEKLGLFVAVGI